MRHESKFRIIKRAQVKFAEVPGLLGRFAVMVGEHGGLFGEITTTRMGKDYRVREVDIHISDEQTFERLADSIREMDDVHLIEVKDVVQETHLSGKIEIASRVKVESIDDLSLVYTPGVASICRKIHANPELAYKFTTIPTNVAIVTNGTAILGLGDIGPVAGMPVMEGKALLFRLLADINGYPILIDSRDPETIVMAVKAIAPTFGAIKLEDIRAPECFEIEERLDAALDIPVLHDDQHGTAVVVLSALINIARYTYLELKRASVGIVGLGAAGSGIQRLLKAFGIQEIYGADISPEMLQRFEKLDGRPAELTAVLAQSDIVIATTGVPGLIKPEMVRPKQVLLALSNPDPEIEPAAAIAAGAAYAVDGKSVNNALAFPGLFRGALEARARVINDAMKIAAAKAIAGFAADGDLVPNILDRNVHKGVAEAVETAALKTGAIRIIQDLDS